MKRALALPPWPPARPRARWSPGADEDATIEVGAVYPLTGSQGQGGIDEHRGALLAAQLRNADGGIDGRTIEIVSTDVSAAEAAPAAHDMLFWETGAVGMLPARSQQGVRTFRMPPTGAVLGSNAIVLVIGLGLLIRSRNS